MRLALLDKPPPSDAISCLLPVYAGDSAQHLEDALRSLFAQTVPAHEIVIVEDGPLSAELRNVLERFEQHLPLLRVALKFNAGLGAALAEGMRHCRHELVARMDADDIAHPRRFERQVEQFLRRPRLQLLGTAIEEFDQRPGDLGRLRQPPNGHGIRKYALKRNPFNHMTVMFRRAAVEAAGGYQHRPGFEDYDLWLRLLALPIEVDNLVEPLVAVRVGNGLMERRRGWRYLRNELTFLRSCHKRALLPSAAYVSAIALRIPSRLLPARMLAWLYRHFLR